jgi:hypothetical protein
MSWQKWIRECVVLGYYGYRCELEDYRFGILKVVWDMI